MDQRRLTWQVRERLTWLAWLLDSSIPIPGTRLTIGLDALIGLVPVLRAALGAPRSILARMAFNVALEGLIGMIPLAGDVFDAAWKANQRNVRLLGAWLDAPRAAQRSSRAFVAALVAGTAAFLVAACVAGFFIARWLWSLLGT